MTFDEFMQTKFAGFLFCCIAFFSTLWFVWRSAEATGYMRGIQETPRTATYTPTFLQMAAWFGFFQGRSARWLSTL